MLRVPWASWEEWFEVREALLGSNYDRLAWSLKRIAAWRSRGSLPVSVEVTSHLCELLTTSPASSTPCEAIRLAMSLALVRMVNGLTESVQFGAIAVPVSTAAARIGLPQFLVDLRHAATHGSLPAIPQLRSACVEAVSWLSQAYWSRQQQHLATLDPDSTSPRVASLLRQYRATARSSTTPGAAIIAANRVVRLVNSASRSAVCDSLVPVLVSGGFLVPRTEKPRTFDLVPEALSGLWLPAVRRFVEEWPHFAPALVCNAARRVSESTSTEYERSLLAAWVAFVTTQWPAAVADDTSSLHAAVACAMSACFPEPSPWSERVAESVLALASPELRARIRALQVVSKGGPAAQLLLARHHDGGIAPSIELCEIEPRVAQMVAPQTASIPPKPWSLVRHPPCPIGLLPPRAEMPNLALPELLDEGNGARFVGFIEEETEIGSDQWVPRWRLWKNWKSQQQQRMEEEEAAEVVTVGEEAEKGKKEEEGEIPTKRKKVEEEVVEETKDEEITMTTEDDGTARMSILLQLLS